MSASVVASNKVSIPFEALPYDVWEYCIKPFVLADVPKKCDECGKEEKLNLYIFNLRICNNCYCQHLYNYQDNIKTAIAEGFGMDMTEKSSKAKVAREYKLLREGKTLFKGNKKAGIYETIVIGAFKKLRARMLKRKKEDQMRIQEYEEFKRRRLEKELGISKQERFCSIFREINIYHINKAYRNKKIDYKVYLDIMRDQSYNLSSRTFCHDDQQNFIRKLNC
jgi:Zn-dependent metalloprotease